MSWAACDRLAKIAPGLGRADRVDHWRAAADRLREIILQRAWNAKRKALRLDASTGTTSTPACC